MMAVVGLLAITSSGLLFWQLVNPARHIRWNDLFSQLPVFFGLGGGLLFYFFLWVCRWGPFQLIWIPIGIGFLLLMQLVRWRQWAFTSEKPSPFLQSWTRLERTSFLLIILILLVATAALFILPLLDWDTRIIWAFKAKILAAEKTMVSETFRDPYRLHIHPRYPLLAPWQVAFLAQLQGGFREYQIQLVVCLYSLLGVQLFYQLNRQDGARLKGLLACLFLIFTGSWLEGFFSSSVEMVLCCYFMLSLYMAMRWLETRSFKNLFLTGFFLLCCAATKNEGLLLALCLFLSLAVIVVFQKKGRFALLSLAGLGIILLALSAIWFWHISWIPPVSDENYFSRLSFPYIFKGLQRLGAISRHIIAHASDLKKWHLLWISFPLLPILAFFKRRFSSPRFLLLFLISLSYLAGILFIYIISPWRDIHLHINVTFDRIMLPMLPVLIMLLLEVGYKLHIPNQLES